MSRSHATIKTHSMAAAGTKAKINIIYYSTYGHVATCKFIFEIKRKF